jgi:serine/threonine-protein kinase
MTTSSGPIAAPLIGGYRVLRLIGQGGMGAVYLAEHALLPRRAALKLLHPMYSSQQEIVDRFFNEARAASSIHDAGIVQIFDFGYHENNAYIVMEFLDGEPLATRLERLGRLALADALRLGYQIAMSLHAAHAVGVIHRDLKPENVVVVADPALPGGERARIVDFGIAKLADTEEQRVQTQTGALLRTPLYMAPEQCRGSAKIDHRADIYALGCVLFHLLCGRPPFEGEGPGDVIVKHVRDEPPRPSQLADVPQEVEAIVLRCLAKDPDARYAAMHDLAIDLDRVLRTSTGQGAAYLTSPLQPSAPPGAITPAPLVDDRAARRRWPIVVAMLAVGGLATGAAVIIAQMPATPRATMDPAPSAATLPLDDVLAVHDANIEAEPADTTARRALADAKPADTTAQQAPAADAGTVSADATPALPARPRPPKLPERRVRPDDPYADR